MEKFEGMKRIGEELALTFTVKDIAEGDNALYSLPEAHFTDGSGKMFDVGGGAMFTRTRDGQGQVNTFHIPVTEYVQPLTFTVSSYPSYIVGDFTVNIK